MGSQPPPSSSDGSAEHRLYTRCVPTALVASKLAGDSLEAFSPARSPDSHELTFSDHAINGESDLFVMQANGMGKRQPFETPENEAFKTTFPARFCPAIRLGERDRVNDTTVDRMLKRFLDVERARSATRLRIAGQNLMSEPFLPLSSFLFRVYRHFMLAKDHAAPEGIPERYAPFYDDEKTHCITSEQRLNR